MAEEQTQLFYTQISKQKSTKNIRRETVKIKPFSEPQCKIGPPARRGMSSKD
jgi:hypothetical protein